MNRVTCPSIVPVRKHNVLFRRIRIRPETNSRIVWLCKTTPLLLMSPISMEGGKNHAS